MTNEEIDLLARMVHQIRIGQEKVVLSHEGVVIAIKQLSDELRNAMKSTTALGMYESQLAGTLVRILERDQ
jgi:hypothetical protein